MGTFAGASLCFADEVQDARQVKQYLENVLGSGVQVNITREVLTGPAQQRRRTQTNPQLEVQKNQQTTHRSSGEESTLTASQKHWQYDTTETLTQLEAVSGSRSITVLYPQKVNASDEEGSTGYTPAEVETLVSSLLGLKPNEQIVVQAYTPPPALAFSQVKAPKIWLWAVAFVLLGVLLGLAAAIYWRKRQQQKKIAYNALQDNLNVGYQRDYPPEEAVAYAPELQ